MLGAQFHSHLFLLCTFLSLKPSRTDPTRNAQRMPPKPALELRACRPSETAQLPRCKGAAEAREAGTFTMTALRPE